MVIVKALLEAQTAEQRYDMVPTHSGRSKLDRDRVALPGRACRAVAVQGQPGRGRGPAPAAGLEGGGRQRPIDRGGRGRGAGAKPSMGDGDHDQGDAQLQPVARPSTKSEMSTLPAGVSIALGAP